MSELHAVHLSSMELRLLQHCLAMQLNEAYKARTLAAEYLMPEDAKYLLAYYEKRITCLEELNYKITQLINAAKPGAKQNVERC